MRGESAVARIGQWTLALAILVVAAVAPLAPVARAQSTNDGAVAPVTAVDSQSSGPSVEVQRWWGAAGAILCGAELRLVRVAPAIGLNPYVLAAGLGGCLLAAMDIITAD